MSDTFQSDRSARIALVYQRSPRAQRIFSIFFGSVISVSSVAEIYLRISSPAFLLFGDGNIAFTAEGNSFIMSTGMGFPQGLGEFPLPNIP